MAKILSIFVMIAMLIIGTLFQGSAAQTTHPFVWRIPTKGPQGYRDWASHQTYIVGDILEFSYVKGAHDVNMVTKAAFDSCTTSNPISTVTTAPAKFNLTSTGEYYFICSFPSHCDAGQKIAINVIEGASTSSPHPHSSASSVSTITIPVVLFYFAIEALLFH